MSLLPVKQNFRLWRGGTWHYRFVWQKEVGTSLEAENTTGFTARMVIVPSGSNTPWKTLTTTLNEHGSGIVFEGITGFVNFIISSTETKEIPWTTATYEFFVRDGFEEDVPIMEGRLSVGGSAL